MRIRMIANPVSGGDARRRIEQARACLEAHGAEVELSLTGARGDARRLAREVSAARVDRLVAAGGDGTLNEVINGLVPADLPVAFLPFGTVNVFALEAAIPLRLEEACRLAVEGRPRRICLGRVNGELFLLMASAGWDAEAVARLRPGVKRWLGRAAYAVSAGEALLARAPAPLEVVLPDGEKVPGYGVVVSNCRLYGGRFLVTPGASMFRDTLEVCVLRRPGRLAMLGFSLMLGLRRTLQPPAVAYRTIKAVDLVGDGVCLQVDGDAAGHLPARIEAVPDAVSLVLPDDIGDE